MRSRPESRIQHLDHRIVIGNHPNTEFGRCFVGLAAWNRPSTRLRGDVPRAGFLLGRAEWRPPSQSVERLAGAEHQHRCVESRPQTVTSSNSRPGTTRAAPANQRRSDQFLAKGYTAQQQGNQEGLFSVGRLAPAPIREPRIGPRCCKARESSARDFWAVPVRAKMSSWRASQTARRRIRSCIDDPAQGGSKPAKKDRDAERPSAQRASSIAGSPGIRNAGGVGPPADESLERGATCASLGSATRRPTCFLVPYEKETKHPGSCERSPARILLDVQRRPNPARPPRGREGGSSSSSSAASPSAAGSSSGTSSSTGSSALSRSPSSSTASAGAAPSDSSGSQLSTVAREPCRIRGRLRPTSVSLTTT